MTLQRHLRTHCWNDQRHTITGLLSCAGRYEQDWSSDYRLHSSTMDPRALFKPIIERVSMMTPKDQPVVVCVDDSLMKKSGRHIQQAGYYRDPLGPPFHTNLIYALRFVQISMATPDPNYIRGHRTIPVGGNIIVKASKDATDEQREAYSPSMCALELLDQVRQTIAKSQPKRNIIFCGDAHYTTATLLMRLPKDVTYIGRLRKDASLFMPCDEKNKGRGRPKSYGRELPTPEELRKDKNVPWEIVKIRRRGSDISVRYKRVARAKWKPAGEERTVQLVVIAPLRCGRDAKGRLKYTLPAFLLCTDPEMPVADLIQAYMVRWGIEVNFREEKQLFGIGEAQVRKAERVMAAPLVAIASYSALLLAGREEFRDGKKPVHLQTGRWQRRWKHKSYRTSDLRKQLYSEAAMNNILCDLENTAA